VKGSGKAQLLVNAEYLGLGAARPYDELSRKIDPTLLKTIARSLPALHAG
jgi:hypothetical protein